MEPYFTLNITFRQKFAASAHFADFASYAEEQKERNFFRRKTVVAKLLGKLVGGSTN